MADEQTAEERAQKAYDRAESQVASAAERLVSRQSFGELLAIATENVVGLTRIGNDALDLALRNLRLAGRRDLIAVQRQLARTEDKLERVLQEVERLQERLAASDAASARRTASPRSNGTTRPRSSSGSKPKAR
ncbi:MAG: hypothetical protein M3P44_11050 [Actinomycetota bacterium]|nr:hypothetical protein [Actinomycetota bacterium]